MERKAHRNYRLVAFIMTTMAVSNIVTAPATSAAIAPGKISQGKTIITEITPGNTTACTAGFINKQQRTLMVTGHCHAGRVGSRVVDENYRIIGHVMSNFYNRRTRKSDVSIIKIYPGVEIGSNTYSGDIWVNPEDVRRGDQICSRGAKTNVIHCGEVDVISKNLVMASRDAGGTFGDSGGPAWIPGKGFVGLFSGFGDDVVIFVQPTPKQMSV